MTGTARMIDVAFALQGRAVPRAYRAALAGALCAWLPWLDGETAAGAHLRRLSTGGGAEVLLSGRSRLVLRVPRERVDTLGALSGRELRLQDCRVTLGEPQPHELLPHGTLFAACVAGDEAEAAFLQRVDGELKRLGVAGRAICGRRQSAEAPAGYALMVDALSAEGSMRLLERGLGTHRLLGCGLFVPHKSTAAVAA